MIRAQSDADYVRTASNGITKARMMAGTRLPREFCFRHLLLVMITSGLVFVSTRESRALDPREYAIEASVEVLAPFALRISWQPTGKARTYTIRRRVFGSADWGAAIATLPAGSSQYTDNAVSEGTPYEYEIQLETTERGAGGWVNAFGYVLAGGKVSWPDDKGKVLVIVDATAASALNTEINSYLRELTGAGWNPIRRDLPRASTVPEVKSLIQSEFNADPAKLRAVILMGHIPVPYSGNIAPDLHESHRGAWPADVFYADMDGNWTDSTVNINSGDYDANDNFIGDGKYDQSEIPTSVELEIGRIDFYNLPAFGGKTQVDLLRAYLQKNSQFRNRVFTAERRMLIRDNFGDLSGDAPAVDAWRHYRQMFGPGTVREVGPGDFFWTLQNESFLWAYGCGGGGNTKADGVGTTTDFANQSPKAVFLMLHGSYFGDWNTQDNFLRAAIASSGYPLASIWSGLPHWFVHPMGLGKNVGFVTRLTQNNLDDYKSHLNFSPRQVHISLIGDPTLENFPVAPPRSLSGTASTTVNLGWSAANDQNIVGYHVYYATGGNGPYQRLTSSPVPSTSFAHAIGTGTHHYMVRAVKLERTGAGTFYNLSQGAFTSVTKATGGELPQVNIAVQDSDASETGPNPGTLRIWRTAASSSALRVDFQVGGTAQEGIDYGGIGAFVTIAGGATETSVLIAPVPDNLVEGSETVSVQLKPTSAYTIGSAASAVLTIADGVNQAPTISKVADQSLTAGVSSADLQFQIGDAETAASSLQVLAQTSNSQILPTSAIVFGGSGANRTVRLTPIIGASGLVTVTLSVTDGVNQSSSAFNVTVTLPNQRPNAFPQLVETLENVSVPITLTGQDPEGKPLTFVIKVPPSMGSITGNPPNIAYVPLANYFGADAFSFAVSDGVDESVPAEVSIKVLESNKPPLAIPLQFSTMEDTPVEIILIGSDPNNDLLQYELVSAPTNGTLTAISNGVYSYLPKTNGFGRDHFFFRVSDGVFFSSPAIVEGDIIAANDAPVARDAEVILVEDQSAEFVLSAEDIDGQALQFTILTPPTNGLLTGSGSNLVFSPNTNFFGTSTLQFTVSDGWTNSKAATVTLIVTPQNDPPGITAPPSVTARKNSTIPSIGLQIFDPDNTVNELLLWAESSNSELIPTNRIVFIQGDTNRQVLLFPIMNQAGESEITLHVSDGNAANQATFFLSITNAPPRANDDFIADSVGTVVIPISRLLSNDFDPDQEEIRLVSVSQSAWGRAVVLTNGAVVYSGPTNFLNDSFTYQIEDLSGATAQALVSLQITEDPRIKSVSLDADDVELRFVGKASSYFRIWSSTDGRTWEYAGRGYSDENGRGQFTDPGGASGHHRLYRVEFP